MTSPLLQNILPSSCLSEYVRRYEIFRFVFDKNTIPPPKYHAPRPEHCLTFYVRDAQKFSFVGDTPIITYPKAIINGIHTMPIYRYGNYDFWAIKVVLQPSALYRLTGILQTKLNNTFVDAQALWGKEIRLVNERLNSSDCLTEMLQIIEFFLETLVKKARISFHPIDKTSQLILHKENRLSIDAFAKQSYLSTRQFIRKFEERVGVSAKTFYRIAHFDRAYRLKNQNPNLDWLSVAIESDYYDYQHLVKDYKEFTHLTPALFFEQDKKAPERTFGLFEK
jgi:AraC-like DNA-binding protein